MKVTLLLSTSSLDGSAGTPESVQLLLVGVFGEASNCSDETLGPIADRSPTAPRPVPVNVGYIVNNGPHRSRSLDPLCPQGIREGNT